MAANRIIPTPVTAASACPDSEAPLCVWRAAHADALVERLSDATFRAGLGAAVRIVRPLAVEVARTLDDAQSCALIGAVIGREKRQAIAAIDSLATDLLASALLLEGVIGDAAARAAIDFLRRRRALPAIDWNATAPGRSRREPIDAGRPTAPALRP